jgi:hypothetical protein
MASEAGKIYMRLADDVGKAVADKHWNTDALRDEFYRQPANASAAKIAKSLAKFIRAKENAPTAQ